MTTVLRTRDQATTGLNRGRAARAVVPRASQGLWQAPSDREDPVTLLLQQAGDRLPELVPIRHGRMMESPFAFFRGSAIVMARDLASTASCGIDVQLCGDAHVLNFGGYASPERRLVFGLNDFDETLPGPWEWDLKRLVASIAIAGRGRGFSKRQRALLVQRTARAYRLAMRQFAHMGNLEVWYARLTMQDIYDQWADQASGTAVRNFQRQVKKAMSKDSARAAAKLTRFVDGERQMISDPPLIVSLDELLADDERRQFEESVLSALRAYRGTLSRDRRHLFDRFRYVGMSRKVVGVGSVGTRTWVMLLLGQERDEPLLLQLKEASASVLAPHCARSEFANQGQRVVEGQRLMQSSSDILLGWSRGPAFDGRSRDFYVRQLWDWKLSPDIANQDANTFGIMGQICGWTLARAHARSGDRLAIGKYLGSRDVFDVAMADFAEAYADQNALDHARFVEAVQSSRIQARPGV